MYVTLRFIYLALSLRPLPDLFFRGFFLPLFDLRTFLQLRVGAYAKQLSGGRVRHEENGRQATALRRD